MYILNNAIRYDTKFIQRDKMPREIKAVKGGKVVIKDNVEEIYEKIITPYGNGAKIDAPKKYIKRRAYVIVLKN